MIRTITHQEYLIACDRCGRRGPAAATVDQASQQVRNQGWVSIVPGRCFDFLTTWYCPACHHVREEAAGGTAPPRAAG